MISSLVLFILALAGVCLLIHLFALGKVRPEDGSDSVCAEDKSGCDGLECFYPECLKYGCSGPDEAD
jgi:hypothetical protein